MCRVLCVFTALSPRTTDIMKRLMAVCELVCLAVLVLGIGVASGQSTGMVVA